MSDWLDFHIGCCVFANRVHRAAIAMEAAKPTRRETGSARKGDSAGRKASPRSNL